MRNIINNLSDHRLYPILADDVRIRKEYFGGLVFKRSTMEIFEVNDITFKLLKLINGLRSIEDIYYELSQKYLVSIKDVYSLILRLIDRQIIQ